MPKLNFDFDYSHKHIAEVIDDRIHSERDRAILKRRLFDGIRFEALAEEFDVSVTTAKTVVKKGQAVIFRHI